MRKTIFIPFLFTILVLTELATADFVFINNSDKNAWVVHRMARDADANYPAGNRTIGWYKISAGTTRAFRGPDPGYGNNSGYFHVTHPYPSEVKPSDHEFRHSRDISIHPKLPFTNVWSFPDEFGESGLIKSNRPTNELVVRRAYEYMDGDTITLLADGTLRPSQLVRGVVEDVPGTVLTGHTGDINGLAWSPDGRTIASGSRDWTIRLWDAATGTTKATLSGNAGEVNSVAFSADGHTLASAHDEQVVILWDVFTRQRKATLRGHTDYVSSIKYSPDGRTIASASFDHTVRLWDVATGKTIYTLIGHNDAVISVAYSPDGRTIASASFDHTVRLWDVATGATKTILEYPSRVISVAFSPDGRTIAGAGWHDIFLWDVVTGARKGGYPGFHVGNFAVTFSPDGRILTFGGIHTTAGEFDDVRLYEVASLYEGAPRRREIDRFRGHTDNIVSLAYSPDGRTLASGSQDDTVRLWQVEAEAASVNIPDPNLRAAIEEALGKAQGATITKTDMLRLTRLYARERSIQDITGLEFATNLDSLDLNGNQITDISPLAKLTKLTYLQLHNYQLSDISPLAGLKNLRHLSLVSDQISDISPLAGLTNLTYLDLKYNQISDISPLAKLTKLDSLALHRNQISDISPLAKLTNLDSLALYDNQISDISPLAKLTNLDSLGLNGNQITDISPLAGLTKLRQLGLSNNQISDFSPIAGLIPNLQSYFNNNQTVPKDISVTIPDPNLRSAIEEALGKTQGAAITPVEMQTLTTLEQNDLGIEDLTGLEFATNLTELYLKGNELVDVSPLAGLTKLTWLVLNDNEILNVSPLAGLTNLTWLRLDYNQISDVSPLTGLTNLTHLYLRGTQLVDVSPLAGLTNLTHLYLRGTQLVDVSPLAGLTNLTSLALDRTQLVDVSPLAGLTNLTWLVLNYNQLVDVSPLAGLTNLTDLYLNDNQISDISPLAELKNLTKLNLSNNQISDFSPIDGLILNLESYGNSDQREPTLDDAMDGPVNIPDDAVREELEWKLRKDPDSPITAADMLTLTEFDSSYPGIQDLTGLEFAKNLTHLRFPNSELSNLTPLAGLKNLTELMIFGNELSDLRPLAGLKNLTELMIISNELSDLRPLAGLKNLTKLTILAHGDELSDLTPLAGLRNLTELSVSNSRKLSDVSPLAGLTNLTRLDIRSNAISDVTPLAGLKNLTVLYLANNAISDVSPLAGLRNLTRLDLGRNRISDVSPLAGLTNLTHLSLKNNQISDFSPIAGLIPNLESYGNSDQREPPLGGTTDGPVNIPDPNLRSAIEEALGKTQGAAITPAEMQTLTTLEQNDQGIQDLTGLEFAINLTDLDLDDNQILDISPLADLINLTDLDLGDNQILDISPLANLINLTDLDLGDNQILDISPLANLINLTRLDLGDNQILDISPLANLINLTRLDLSDNQILDISPLANLINLTHFSLDIFFRLGDNQISDISPLAGLKQLTTLFLRGNAILDISPLANLINLIDLDLGGNAILDISPLANLINLRYLNLNSNQHIPDISALAELKQLTHLFLWGNAISDISPLAINLIDLGLGDNEISDISALAELKQLTDLSLWNNEISDISPLANLINLTRLNLDFNEISDISPLANLINLIDLGLGDNEISDVSPLANLINLTRLSLDHNQISDFSPLDELRPNLKSYSISGQLLLGLFFTIADLSIADLSSEMFQDTWQLNRSIANSIKKIGITIDGESVEESSRSGYDFRYWFSPPENPTRKKLVIKSVPFVDMVFSSSSENDFGSATFEPNRVRTDKNGQAVTYITFGGEKKNISINIELLKLNAALCVVQLTPDPFFPALIGDRLAGTRHIGDVEIYVDGKPAPSYLVGKYVNPLFYNLGKKYNSFITSFAVILPQNAEAYFQFKVHEDTPQDSSSHGALYTINTKQTADIKLERDYATSTQTEGLINIGMNTGSKSGVSVVKLNPLTRAQLKGTVRVAGRDEDVSIDDFFYQDKNLTPINIASQQEFKHRYAWNVEKEDTLAFVAVDGMRVEIEIRTGRILSTGVEIGAFVKLYEGDSAATNDLEDVACYTFISPWVPRLDDFGKPEELGEFEDYIELGGEGRLVNPTRLTSIRLLNSFLSESQQQSVTAHLRYYHRSYFERIAKLIGIDPDWVNRITPDRFGGDEVIVVFDLQLTPINWTPVFGAPVAVTTNFVSFSDVNSDGQIDAADLVLVSNYIGQTAPTNPPVDVNGDGAVTIADLVQVAQYLGQSTTSFAPARVVVPAGLKYATVEGWIHQARLEDDGSLVFNHGIAKLEYLLTLIIPQETALLHNYPNPFNPETWIPYHLAEPADVTLTIYAVDGKVVRRLDLGHQAAGYYQSKSRAAYWDGRNAVGERVASGIYFYTLTAGDFRATGKMLIRK